MMNIGEYGQEQYCLSSACLSQKSAIAAASLTAADG